MGDPLNAHASRSMAKTAQPDNAAVIGKVMVVAAAKINLFGHHGDKVPAGGANESPFPHLVIMLKDRKAVLQVGQVIEVLFRGVSPERPFSDEGGSFIFFNIFCHTHYIK